jgi:hypothetical protein
VSFLIFPSSTIISFPSFCDDDDDDDDDDDYYYYYYYLTLCGIVVRVFGYRTEM